MDYLYSKINLLSIKNMKKEDSKKYEKKIDALKKFLDLCRNTAIKTMN